MCVCVCVCACVCVCVCVSLSLSISLYIYIYIYIYIYKTECIVCVPGHDPLTSLSCSSSFLIGWEFYGPNYLKC